MSPLVHDDIEVNDRDQVDLWGSSPECGLFQRIVPNHIFKSSFSSHKLSTIPNRVSSPSLPCCDVITDDLIQERRKQQQQESKRGPKKPSVVERSIATGRAKRDAAMNQRRGLSQTKKPTAMEVEKQVKRQTDHTAKEKKIQEKKATKGRIAPDSTSRNKKKKGKKNDAVAPIFGGRTPPKKAIEAALKGMETAGYKVPDGHTVVMTFVPVVVPAATTQAKPPAPAKETKKPEAKGKKGGPAKNKGNNSGKPGSGQKKN